MERKQKDQGAPPAQSKASHTPGPWEAAKSEQPGWVVFAREVGASGKTYPRTVAHVPAAMAQEANAKLIAAAPALADALEVAFREMVNEANAIGADDYHEAINRAAAALRLAGRLL